MKNIKEIVLFTGFGAGFYTDELKNNNKTATDMEMRFDIFTEYIKKQKDMKDTGVDTMELYDNLEVGEGLRVGNAFYCREEIADRSINVGREDWTGLFVSEEFFSNMVSGEKVQYEGITLLKSIDGKKLFKCSASTSTAEIVEVDTNREWTIKDCNGAEYIEYLD